MPQQPIHTAVFPNARSYAAMPDAKEAGWFDTVTNPWEGEVDGWRFLGREDRTSMMSPGTWTATTGWV